MNLEEKKKLLEDTAKELLENMGFKATIRTAINGIQEEISDDMPITIEIELSESNYLIGKHGINLSALQHVLRILVRKKASETEKMNFSVDVNGYRAGQQQSIVRIAREAAEKALSDKKTVVLRPMNAYERRIVHMKLSEMEGIQTESIGEGEERKVVVKPATTI